MPTSPFLGGLGNAFLNDNWEAAMNNVFAPFLKPGRKDPFSNFVRGLSGDLQGQYLGMLPDNPTLMPVDFLRQQNPMAMWQSLAPSQRGERSAPQVRWMNLFGSR